MIACLFFTKTRGHNSTLVNPRCNYNLKSIHLLYELQTYGTVYLNLWSRLKLLIHLRIGSIDLGKIRIWCMCICI